MTSSPDQPGLTAHALLLGADKDVGVLARALSEHDALQQAGADLTRLTRQGRQAASDSIASVTAGMLGLDLGDMLISAWRKRELLLTAAQRTLKSPGSEEVVQLASHRVTSTYQPKVDLMINDVRIHTFEFTLTVDFDIEVAAAIIDSGKLVGLRSGDVRVSAVLSMAAPGGDIDLINRERQIDLPLILHLGQGIPLLPADSAPPSSKSDAVSSAAE